MAVAPQNIMAQLRGMPDAELAKFAATYKNDPFIFPLAFQESQSRKQLRASQQAKMAGQEQPKVVDQAISQMAGVDPMGNVTGYLPEDTGIGRLPAKNLTKLADGGIVAFEEGGEVPRFNGLFGSVPQQAPGDLGIYSFGSFGPQQGDAALQERIARIESNPRMARADKDALIAQARQEFAAPKTNAQPTQFAPMGGSPSATTPAAPANTAATNTSPLINRPATVVERALIDKVASDKAAAADKAAADKAAADKGEKKDKVPPAPPPGLPSINSYMKQFEMALPEKEKALDEASFMKKREEPMKAYFDKANQNIEAEKSRLKTDKEQDFYMALIQGGLATAAGNSKYALQNIAQGLGQGAAQYREALKDFRKASQENAKMEMDLQKAQAADKKGDMDAYQKHSESVADRNAKIDQLKTSGVATLLGHQMSANASMSNAGAQERLITKIGTDPKFAEAYKTYATTGINARGDQAILQQYSGPKGEIALKMLEAGTPEQKAYAAQVRQQLRAVMMPNVMTQPTGDVRP